jgi:hypothetical protein
MGFSVSYSKPDNLRSVERFMLSLGKALHLVATFESKCNYVLRIGKGVHFMRDTPSRRGAAVLEYMAGLEDDMLGRTIRELAALDDVSPESVRTLNESREARNELVHELGALGSVYLLSNELLDKQRARLLEVLDRFIPGDELISRWIFCIENPREPLPWTSVLYPDEIRHWVFGQPDVVAKLRDLYAERGVKLPPGYEW